MFLLISFFFLLLLTTPVRADMFCQNGDSAFNMYAQTTAISISKLPTVGEGIEYDMDNVFGSYTDYVLENYTISNLATGNHNQRYPNILDRVSAPPGTDIDLSYFYTNRTTHDIEILKIVMFFSKDRTNDGDWTKIVDISEPKPNWGLRDVLFSNQILVKKGFLKEYDGLGHVPMSETGVFVLDTMKIIDPLYVKDLSYEENDNSYDISLNIVNSSNEDLNNLQIGHGDINFEFSIPADDEILLAYSLENIEEDSFLHIHNPNSRTECIVFGTPPLIWDRTSAVTVMALRHSGWINGAYLQTAIESFCITRIPYTSVFLLQKNEDIQDYENDKDSDSIVEENGSVVVEVDIENQGDIEKEEEIIEVVNQEVLGVTTQEIDITTLPKTGKIY